MSILEEINSLIEYYVRRVEHYELQRDLSDVEEQEYYCFNDFLDDLRKLKEMIE